MKDLLKARQDAGQRVEAKMMDFLLDFTPAHELRVGEVQTIARFARQIAFAEFTEAERPESR